MALVKYGGGITQMSGSIAGNTFARNRSGNYVRARTKPVNPNSAAQITCRSGIAQIVAYWNDIVTPNERIAWSTYANAVAFKNKLGETTYLSGFNHFVRYNAIYLRQAGLIEASGPSVLALPAQDSTVSVVAKVTGNNLEITYDAGAEWQSIPGSQMIIWCGQPQLATRNFFAGPWKLAGGIAIGQANPKVISAPYTLILGQKIWIYARILIAPTDPRLSNPTVKSTVVVA